MRQLLITHYYLIPSFFMLPLFPPLILYRIHRQRQGVKGMTPVELVIIYLILSVMGAIAIPRPHGFHPKAKQSEAKTLLGQLFTAQLAYRDSHGTFAGGQMALSLLRWEPEGSTRYAYYCGEDYWPNDKGLIIPPDTILTQSVSSSATGFTCMAVGNIDNDPDLDYWSINDAKVIQNLPSTDL